MSIKQIPFVLFFFLEWGWPPHSKHQRLWFFPGEFLSAKVAVAGSGLVNWPLQTQLSVHEKKERVNIRRQFRKRQCNLPYEKLHVLHDNPRPQVKVLLHNLQQLVFVPVGCTVIKHRDGEWMAHTDGIGDLQGITEMGRRINILL